MLSTAIVLAHPGHGATEPASWLHYFTEPEHVIPLALALAAIVAIAVLRRRATRQRDQH
jgi:MYXO-CTERM domain-containing protein